MTPGKGRASSKLTQLRSIAKNRDSLEQRGEPWAYLERRTPWEFFKKAAEEVLENMRARIERLSVAFFQGTAEASKEAAPPPSQL